MAFIDPDSDRGPGRDAVELYTRTYGTLLRSSGETKLKVLEQSHIGMQSSLHPKAGSAEPDTGALIYALRRLPPSITAVRRIVLGQSADVFKRMLDVDVEKWEMQSAPGRRRRYYFDGKETLAVYIASPSDIDDVIPQLVALQIEWNKLHALLSAEDLGPATEVTDLAMKACGGAAFSKQLPIERYFRDARAGWVMAPTVDHLHDLITGHAMPDLPVPPAGVTTIVVRSGDWSGAVIGDCRDASENLRQGRRIVVPCGLEQPVVPLRRSRPHAGGPDGIC